MAPTNFLRLTRRLVVRGGFLIPKGVQSTSDADITRASLLVPALRHAQCVAITNQSIAAGALPTIDGYAVQEGDRVLLAGQTTKSQNGPWIASAAGWTRPNDFPTSTSITSRSLKVTGGTLFAGTDWMLLSTAAITVDTNNQTWQPTSQMASDWHKPVEPNNYSAKVGTWALANQSAAYRGGYVWNSSGAQNDGLHFDLELGAGTWNLQLVTPNQANAAIATAELDGTSIGTADLYAAATTYNHVYNISFTVAFCSKHRI